MSPPPPGSLSFVDRARIDALLADAVPDPDDRAWMLRCILDEGPHHHRGVNYVLIALLGEVLARLGGPAPSEGRRSVRVPMRLHPLAERDDALDRASFPLAVPTRPLDVLAPAGGREQAAMLECLTDGPAQHALANAAMMQLLDGILARIPTRGEGA